MAEGTCPHCGAFKKNLGSHMRHCTSGADGVFKIKVDDYLPEKPLSSVISDIKQVLRQYRAEIEVTTIERGGTTEEIEILTRIQLRR